MRYILKKYIVPVDLTTQNTNDIHIQNIHLYSRHLIKQHKYRQRCYTVRCHGESDMLAFPAVS